MLTSLLTGDCLAILPTLPADSIDAIVTDPPYGLSFMGKAWDHGVPGEPFWREALRVAKPGAHLVAFGGARTYHRLTCAIEDAGWEIRDCLMWLYGSGFPKSHNGPWGGTALKPAWEPIILARNPLVGTVAQNVQAYGTGAINVDGCRIAGVPPSVPQPCFRNVTGRATRLDATQRNGEMSHASGRWPANLLLDEESAVVLGEPSRFFYCAKASRKDRGDGNTHPTVKPHDLMRWLVRLVTPPGGTVLDPFMGSGSTGKAALAEGRQFVGIEQEAAYVEMASSRLAYDFA